MKKAILYIFAIIGILFALGILRAFWSGFSSTFNPSGTIQKAKCVSECNKNKLSENCPAYCAEQMIQK